MQAICAEAEAQAEARRKDLEVRLIEAQKDAQTSEERASAAEMAKIQLSMQLAEIDDGQQTSENTPLEEAEETFATNVTARRVAPAEREVAELRQKLRDAESTIGQLEFQVESQNLMLESAISFRPSVWLIYGQKRKELLKHICNFAWAIILKSTQRCYPQISLQPLTDLQPTSLKLEVFLRCVKLL